MKGKLVPIDDGATVDKVKQEIEQEAKTTSSQANRSKKKSAIAVAIDASISAAPQTVVQTNVALQTIVQFHIPINANVDDVAGLVNGLAVPLVSQFTNSLKVGMDNDGSLTVNGKKVPAANLGEALNMVVVGQEKHSENITSEEGGK